MIGRLFYVHFRFISGSNIGAHGHNLAVLSGVVCGQPRLQDREVRPGRSNLQLDLRPRRTVDRPIRRHNPTDELLQEL